MTRLPIIRYRNLWFLISGALVAASIVCLLAFPLRFGIDFTGGSLLELSFTDIRPSPAEVSDALSDFAFSESVIQPVEEDGLLLRFPPLDEAKHREVVAALEAKFTGATELRFESVGPTVGAELRGKAVWSLSLVMIAIAVYVAYAFRKVTRPVASWKYGLITLIAALFHDVLIPLGVFAVLGRFLLVDINSGFIAAILTVLGFSVHDTIVVFDRIRENLLKTGGAFEDVVERSVNETVARSINTSLTTLFPLAAIFFLGGESLKYFSLALLVGIAAGTYSSIFLAAPLLVVMQKKER